MVEQNLLLSMRFLKLRQKEKEKRIRQILQTVGLSHLENAVVNTLSGVELSSLLSEMQKRKLSSGKSSDEN